MTQLSPPSQPRVDVRQSLEGKRCVQLRHPRIESDELRLVVTRIAVVTAGPQAPSNVVVGGGNEPALAGREQLGRAEAEHLGIAETPDGTTLPGRAKAMRGIKDQRSTGSTSKSLEALRRARCTEEVRRHDHAGVSEPELCIIVIEVKRTPVAIGKSWDQSVPSHGVRRRREGEARDKHRTVAWRDGSKREHEPRGA